jgi:Domain of unknown function (DUF5076)
MRHELPIPPAAVDADHSLEMIRVWLAQKKVYCVLNIGFWEERGMDERDCWGILLADMMHHIADAHEAEYGREPNETLARIRETFERELERATSKRLGEFVAKQNDPDTTEK